MSVPIAGSVDVRTGKELELVAQLVCSEVEKMVHSAIMARLQSDESAFYESSMLHMRKMIEFLCEPPGQRITAGRR